MMSHLPFGSEHRWGERIRVNLPVVVLVDGRTGVGGQVNNLSLSGALLQSDHDLPLYALIGVQIDLPSQAGDSCVVRARVSRKPAHGVGIEWCEFAPAVVKELLRSPLTK